MIIKEIVLGNYREEAIELVVTHNVTEYGNQELIVKKTEYGTVQDTVSLYPDELRELISIAKLLGWEIY